MRAMQLLPSHFHHVLQPCSTSKTSISKLHVVSQPTAATILPPRSVLPPLVSTMSIPPLAASFAALILLSAPEGALTGVGDLMPLVAAAVSVFGFGSG